MNQQTTRLDRIDMRILVELQKNGRMTNVTLADAVGLSASPCLLRVKRMEQAGYITGYGAHIALPKLGETVTVFTEITLSGHAPEYFQRFEQSLRKVDEAMEAHLVSGGYDYLVKFVTRGLSHYQDVIEALLERNVGIAKYFSYIVLRTPIVKTELPLATLFGDAR
ncbi:Lrp/AsnC family transcriptional regulator [Methylobacterium nonmethylotrophicum]|nr:Lrp/AsnC family transcriptional regulator [Methylobacterium nonmethylotrophicum]